jgi:hypothetical protein
MSKYKENINSKTTPIQVKNDICGFAINDQYLFAWSDQEVYQMELKPKDSVFSTKVIDIRA